jgi:hypothetical protein
MGQPFLFQAPSEYMVGVWPFRARKFKATDQRMIGKRFTCLGIAKDREAAESRGSDLASFLLECELSWQKSAVCQRDFGIHWLSGFNVRQKCQAIQGSKSRLTFQVRKFCESTRQLDFLTILLSAAGKQPLKCVRIFFIRFECNRKHLSHVPQFIGEILPEHPTTRLFDNPIVRRWQTTIKMRYDIQSTRQLDFLTTLSSPAFMGRRSSRSYFINLHM